jgi:hypothetical protein
MRDGVAGLDVGGVLDVGNDVADVAGAERRDLLIFGMKTPTSLISDFWPLLMSCIMSPALSVPEKTRT